MSRSLTERLKSETRALHIAAERSGFMGKFLQGRLARSAYCGLLRNLHAIYAGLEPALERHQAHPLIAPVFLPALWRQGALAQDLVDLHGPRWSDELALQPATIAYTKRLHTIDLLEPALLLSHAYVRYLGDLSGGQMLRRIVTETLACGANRGVAFYDFGDAAETRCLVDAFRAGLADVKADAAQSDALLGEAKLAFGLHVSLFEELNAP